MTRHARRVIGSIFVLLVVTCVPASALYHGHSSAPSARLPRSLVRLQTYHQVLSVLKHFGDSELWSYQTKLHTFKSLTIAPVPLTSALYTTTRIATAVGDPLPAVVVGPVVGAAKARITPSSLNKLHGGAMPTTAPAGWTLSYEQDFNGTRLPPGWGAYAGEPGGDPYGWWDPANLSVSGGSLHFGTRYNAARSMYSTAGISYYVHPQTYGKYLVRLKGDAEPGLSISNIALLWPVANVWPPEVDFYEDNGGTRSAFMATLHAGPNGNDAVLVQHRRALDDTRWHTVGVEWTPTTISYTVDGATWAVVPTSALPGGGHWPDQPMFLSIQSQNVGPAQPSAPIETMTVAWVAIYAPA